MGPFATPREPPQSDPTGTYRSDAKCRRYDAGASEPILKSVPHMFHIRVAISIVCLLLVSTSGCKQTACGCRYGSPQHRLIVATIDTGGTNPELKWGEFGYYSNWNRYPYAIRSDAPYLGRLADLREFPLLLNELQNPKWSASEKGVLFSQLRTLSRCDFDERPVTAEQDPEEVERQALAKWVDWWQRYGSGLTKTLETQGKRYPSAWKQIAPTPYLECPGYPLSIPKTWSSIVSFRSGDYGGVTEEIIEFVVNEDRCELRRQYRHGWSGRAPWTHEVWKDFSREEAEQFLAALIYAIDHPWFYADDQLADRDEFEGLLIGSINGRPGEWSDYYPFCDWTGIQDANQRVLINHDPWNWDTIDHNLAGKTSLDGGAFGVVFRVVRDLFPDPTFNAAKSRWKKVDAKPQDDATATKK